MDTTGAKALGGRDATGKTILIKYGGAAMVDPELRNAVMSDIVMLKIMGVNPVIVHGGGAAINKNMDKLASSYPRSLRRSRQRQ